MTKKDLRIVFMGTPEFAVETLRRLVEGGWTVAAVVTQPDKPVGRHGSVLQPSAVKKYALAHGLPVLQPEKMKDPQFVEALRSLGANLQVVVAFRMLPEVVWAMPEYGTFNVHAALLPQYRGAAPINWAIINGEKRTGVTTFFLDHDIDTGRIIMQKPFDIPDDADVEYVYDGLMRLGADICVETLEAIVAADGHPASIAQSAAAAQGLPVGDGLAGTGLLHAAPKIFKETCRIDWTLPATSIYNFVRGLSPVPGAWTMLATDDGREQTLKIYRTAKSGLPARGDAGTITVSNRRMYVSASDELLEITELQMAGKKRMAAADFLNGVKSAGQWKVF